MIQLFIYKNNWEKFAESRKLLEKKFSAKVL